MVRKLNLGETFYLYNWWNEKSEYKVKEMSYNVYVDENNFLHDEDKFLNSVSYYTMDLKSMTRWIHGKGYIEEDFYIIKNRIQILDEL